MFCVDLGFPYERVVPIMAPLIFLGTVDFFDDVTAQVHRYQFSQTQTYFTSIFTREKCSVELSQAAEHSVRVRNSFSSGVRIQAELAFHCSLFAFVFNRCAIHHAIIDRTCPCVTLHACHDVQYAYPYLVKHLQIAHEKKFEGTLAIM